MAYKYTITINATITTTKDYDAVVSDMTEAVKGLGTATLTTNVQANQWVDQTTMEAQIFNDDGTPYVEPVQLKEIETTETTTA